MSRHIEYESAAVRRFHKTRTDDRRRDQVMAMASTLISLVDLRDCYTGGHSTRVGEYSQEIGLQMGLDDEYLETLLMAASLHDVGKIGVPDRILLKEGRLTDDEFEYIKKHSEFGWMVLRNIEGFEEAALMLLHHHERYDGRGYPGELAGQQIPLGARIIAVADAFDAMTTNRPYRCAWDREKALAEISRCAGAQFDRDVVEAFLKHWS